MWLDLPELRGRVWRLDEQKLLQAGDILLFHFAAFQEPVGNLLVDLPYALDALLEDEHGETRLQVGLWGESSTSALAEMNGGSGLPDIAGNGSATEKQAVHNADSRRRPKGEREGGREG